MKQKYILITLAAIILISVFYSCKDNPVNPPPVKSPRDYTWTVDTLNIPDAFQNLMRSMYAANAEDIYLVGHNSGSQIYPGDGQMWHYNGKKWAVVRLNNKLGGFFLYSIHGSSSNNVWAVGSRKRSGEDFYRGFAMQYDGVSWKEHKLKQKNGLYGPLSHNEIYSVFVESETNVWACGAGGLVYHYDGNNWDIDTVKIKLNENEKLALNDVVVFNSDLYVLGIKYLKGNLYGTHYLIKKIGTGFGIIDSLVEDVYGNTEWKWGTSHFYRSNSNRLYSCGFGGVFQFNGNYWTNIFEYESPVLGVSEKSEKDILAVGDFSLVVHYNGADWIRLSELNFNDVVYTGVWQDSDEAFIVGLLLGGYPQKTIVIHGK
ncbi:hypothetical protein BMS3Abin04_02368 [bacterium BMS3Abin04]|nr:hypothetical protein BMS3Abin04_02368 [bacterium BMS3Abin04]